MASNYLIYIRILICINWAARYVNTEMRVVEFPLRGRGLAVLSGIGGFVASGRVSNRHSDALHYRNNARALLESRSPLSILRRESVARNELEF